ncbi:DUF4149 domain-containing protein [Campylobacter ureolyticus]|uniref:DUF4149 domain-containing membrane protein n=1 Tax=Campylobacter ureolyticus TaxID=827 RepID=A0AAE7EAS1_9BACT|nr:DUF4149 domain-containing protein [Campylobacter ureolyticus]MCR8685013.1 DUF4149 domain-containing protein [Campylobacter ureolyticus]QKF84742.1 DUF4149 domain-containing membrane protein [Campylobacter ureolyticus]QQY35090.1 DUF4149 domain-containing protein [Campylobacter ureolyticus]SUX21357.1 putative integral membrane protein [Campylobacter ureolyticus]
MNRILNIYLFLIAILVGLEICAGVFVAPVIFNPANLIGEGVLTHFQSGQIMTEIFLRFNKILLIISILAFIAESINLANKNKNFNIKFSTFMLAFINLVLALLFIFYFSNYIVNAQQIGPSMTQTASFAQMHKASEWTMKIMLIAQTFLFFIKFPSSKNELKQEVK